MAKPAPRGYARPLPVKKSWYAVTALLALLACAACLLNPIATAVSPLMAVSEAISKTGAALEDRFEASPLAALRILAASTQYGRIHTSYSYENAGGAISRGDLTLLCNGIGRDFAALASLDSGQTSASFQLYLNQERLAFKTPETDDCLYGVSFASCEDELAAFAPVSGLGVDALDALSDTVAFLNSAIHANNIAAYEEYAQLVQNFVMNLTPVEGRERVTINGETAYCKTVRLELTESVVKQLIWDAYSLLREDGGLVPSLPGLKVLAEGLTGESLPSAPDSTPFEELGEQLQYFESAYKGSIYVTFDISGSALVRCVASVPRLNEGGRLLITAVFGKNPETDDISLTVSDPGTGAELLNMTLSTSDGPDSRTDLIRLKYGSEEARASLMWQNETSVLALELQSPGVNVGGSGTLRLEAGTLALNFDDLNVSGNRLALSVSAKKGVTIHNPAYVSLDSWGSITQDRRRQTGSFPEYPDQ